LKAISGLQLLEMAGSRRTPFAAAGRGELLHRSPGKRPESPARGRIREAFDTGLPCSPSPAQLRQDAGGCGQGGEPGRKLAVKEISEIIQGTA